jgi:predicted RNA methylase
MQMDDELRQALASISWQKKGDEWLGKLNYQIGPGQWKSLRAVTAMIRMPYIANRKRFVLPAPFEPADIIRTTLEVGSVPSLKDNDFFPTPPDGAGYMCRRAYNNPRTGIVEHILEPSAGSGAIIAAALAEFPDAKITAVEYDPLNCALLRHHYPDRVTVIQADFLTWTPDREYDLVLMNPPFTANGGYAKHIVAAMQCLRNDCELYAIVPTNVTYKDKAFARWLAEHQVYLTDFEFQFADTNVKTMLVELVKCAPWIDEPSRGYKTYRHYLLEFNAVGNDSECGEAVYRWAKSLYAKKGDPVANYEGFANPVLDCFRRNPKTFIGISFTDEELKQAAWNYYRDRLSDSFNVSADNLTDYLKPYPPPAPTPAPKPTKKAAPAPTAPKPAPPAPAPTAYDELKQAQEMRKSQILQRLQHLETLTFEENCRLSDVRKEARDREGSNTVIGHRGRRIYVHNIGDVGKEGKKVWKAWSVNMGNVAAQDAAEAKSWFLMLYRAGVEGKPAPMHEGGMPLARDERQAHEAGKKDRDSLQAPSRKSKPVVSQTPIADEIVKLRQELEDLNKPIPYETFERLMLQPPTTAIEPKNLVAPPTPPVAPTTPKPTRAVKAIRQPEMQLSLF